MGSREYNPSGVALVMSDASTGYHTLTATGRPPQLVVVSRVVSTTRNPVWPTAYGPGAPGSGFDGCAMAESAMPRATAKARIGFINHLRQLQATPEPAPVR